MEGKRLVGDSCQSLRDVETELRQQQRGSPEEVDAYDGESTAFVKVEYGDRADGRNFWKFQIFNGCLGGRCCY